MNAAIAQVVSGIMGVVAVGSFAIPIGILGAGFQEWVQDNYAPSSGGGDDGPEPDAPSTLTGRARPPPQRAPRV